MPNILIIGAPGYIGLPLSLALLRTGAHTVYGLARTPARATLLQQHEIIPIEGDVTTLSTWAPALSKYAIDLVIDSSSAFQSAALILSTVIEESRRRSTALAADPTHKLGPRLGFLYVSGTWVHGSPALRAASDRDVVGSEAAPSEPPAISAQRPAYEQAVLRAHTEGLLDVAIVRPAVVYGRGTYILDPFLGSIREAAKSQGEGVARVPLDEGAVQNVVHVDDVADAVARVAARVGLLGDWPVFDVMAERVDFRALMEASARLLGFEGKVEFVGAGDNVLAQAMSGRAWGDSERVKLVLGWTPRRLNLLSRLEPVVKAWEAAQIAKVDG